MFKKLLSFKGRVTRLEYILTGVVAYIVSGLVIFIPILGLIGDLGAGTFGVFTILGLIISLAVGVCSIWVSWAATAKRFHDIDRSGWTILLLCIPIVDIYFAIIALFSDGTVGPNRFGEDPKGRVPQVMGQPVNINVNVQLNAKEGESK